jgi:uncharacterized protein (DUF1697 family)
MKYLVLLRGINVGGKNLIPMASLRRVLEGLGFSNVSTYIASGNAVLESNKSADAIGVQLQEALPGTFRLDDDLIRVLVLTRDQLKFIVDNKPQGFGEHPEKYHSDAIFLIGIDSASVMPLFSPREGVDTIWPGKGVVYSQRLSSQRTKSRLNKIMTTTAYKSMTIRTWSTTTRLLKLLTE